MNLSEVFNQTEHDQLIIDCFFKLWHHSADLMFIMAVEPNGEFSLFDNNPASRAVMGLSKEAQIHRMNIRETWGDDIVEGLYQSYREAIAAREPISVPQHAMLDGKDMYVDTLLVPMFDAAGEPVFVCGVSRDISKIKEAEKMAIEAGEKLREYSAALEEMNQRLDQKVQERTAELEDAKKTVEEALAAKSSFVARMSHEIRTPINAVIGLSDLSLKTSLDDPQKDYLQKILDSGKVLLGLVDDVLDFSKIEAGKLEIETVPFSPEKIVQHAINMNALKVAEKNIKLMSYIDDSLPNVLLGDPLRIQQVLVNLVSNAVKFTEIGEVSIRLCCDSRSDDKLVLRCEVEDSGVGISEKQIATLFQSFQQADNSITRKYGGTGLGLTISRQLCELMGGEIWVESDLGKGAKFVFTLPLTLPLISSDLQDKTDSAKTLLEPLRVESNVPDLSMFHILLVDDNPINIQVAMGYLKESRIKVDIVYNGQESLNQVALQHYDLILMDVQMPVMDGYTATRFIRDDLNKDLPIIAMTAHVSKDAKEKAKQAGMNDHLGKPIVRQELYEVLQSYLSFPRSIESLNADSVAGLIISSQGSGEQESHKLDRVLYKINEIKELDIVRAIRNMSGKKALYLDLVMTFYRTYQKQKVELKKLLLDLSNENIVFVIHTLKSNAAYIGAFDLSTSCSVFESDCLRGKGELALLKSIFSSLEELLNNLHTALNVADPEHQEKSSPAEFSKKMLHSALVQVLPLLEKSDFSVEEHLGYLCQTAITTEYADDIDAILSYVNEIEYEKAADRVRQLLQNF